MASQYRPGAPNGYGFLQYSNASAGGLPPTPTVQENATLPWNQSQIDKARSLCGAVDLADWLSLEVRHHHWVLQHWPCRKRLSAT